ncbi:hypothetical protein MCC93_23090 [Morococcus cerebrosus]|uniref:Uncharacterized protein n=1 Tax=Morococcus cerebrosus TaxID=1056807 RepID=A0A0C1GL73_9NEIS|nr:hypothetical protein MCC93_23090 [Morococcus cerebrosus]
MFWNFTSIMLHLNANLLLLRKKGRMKSFRRPLAGVNP